MKTAPEIAKSVAFCVCHYHDCREVTLKNIEKALIEFGQQERKAGYLAGIEDAAKKVESMMPGCSRGFIADQIRALAKE